MTVKEKDPERQAPREHLRDEPDPDADPGPAAARREDATGSAAHAASAWTQGAPGQAPADTGFC